MPHVVLRGDISLADFHAGFEPFAGEHNGVILKVTDAFLHHEGTIVLLEALVVDRRPKGFLVLLDRRGDQTTVRLYPRTDPEKCDGVRRLLAIVAERLLRTSPGAEVGVTNLSGFFSEGEAPW